MKLSVPAAIFLGLTTAGGLIAAAILIAPRSSEPESSTVAAFDAAPAVAASSASPAAAASLRAQDAREALKPAVSRLASECWGSRDGDSMSGTVDLTVEGDGGVISHGVKEPVPMPVPPPPGKAPPPPAGHGDVLSCMNRKLDGLQVPAPGERVHVEVPFSLP
jgi:hypothetical protein